MTDAATESFFPIPDTCMSLFYRTWGNPVGIPVLFVHGGPGNDVAHYKSINAGFFAAEKYFVVEVDQRGSGRSIPAVREGVVNMKYYMDISIDKMSNDFELLRDHLKIDKWLVFGGSWGSALGLDYAERFPNRCLGLMIRGIYLNTRPEFDAVYARASFEGNERQLKEFDIFFELAAQEAERRGEEPLLPSQVERFIRLYEDMVHAGNRDAIWRFFVFESNLADEDPATRIDPLVIDEEMFPEATTVSFFECRLFLRGTFEDIVDLLGPVDRLKGIPTWVIQGTGDEVCPDVYARQLVARLEEAGVPHVAHFVDAGHRASSNLIANALKASLEEFCATIASTIHKK